MDFIDEILPRFWAAMHTFQEDNWDAHRFGADGVDRSMEFDDTRHSRFLKYFMAHAEEFGQTRDLLEDVRSKELYEELILFRLLGHLHVRLSTNVPAFRNLRERAFELKYQGILVPPVIGRPPWARFQWVSEGERVTADLFAGCVADSVLARHYFLEREGIRVRPERGDHCLDLGAMIGETALAFATAIGPEGRVYAFDFVPEHLRAISHNLGLNPHIAPRVKVFPFGVAESDNGVPPWPARPGPMRIQPGVGLDRPPAEPIPLRAVDDLVDAGEIERLDFVKFDIEGAELLALQGMERALARFRPRLAVSLYHRIGDFVEIPRWLSARGYRLFLDHYTIHSEETVLFALPG